MKKRLRGFELLPDNYKEGYRDAKLPQRATIRSAGYDLSAAIEGPWRLLPHGRLLIPTGLTAYMQDEEECQIRPRSGLAYKYGVTVLNSPGTIDADFYGKHIQVLLLNTSPSEFIINPGDRIAQAVFKPYLITDDDDPMSNERNGGFGHTGVGSNE